MDDLINLVLLRPKSSSACFTGPKVFLKRSLLNSSNEVLHATLVEILATQVGFAIGGNSLKDTATTEIVHKDVLLCL